MHMKNIEININKYNKEIAILWNGKEFNGKEWNYN